MSEQYEILGRAAASNRDALMSIRKAAWRKVVFASEHGYSETLKLARQELFAAEDELLFWPLESPQEAAMI